MGGIEKNSLPGYIKRIAAEQGIDVGGIIAFGRGDLNAQCGFKDTYILADKEALHILYMHCAPSVRVFGGYFDSKKRPLYAAERGGAHSGKIFKISL